MKANARLTTTSLLPFVLAWSVLLLLRPPAASAVPGRLTDDAWVQDGDSLNFGVAGVLNVKAQPPNDQKAFIKFDLMPLTSALLP